MSEGSKDQAALREHLLLEAVRQLLDIPRVTNDLTGALEYLKERARNTGKQLQDLRTELASTKAAIAYQATVLDSLCRLQECLEVIGQQQQRLTDQHYERHIIEPMARHLFRLRDLVKDTTAERSHINCLKAIRAGIIELLNVYGIELLDVSKGMAFDPKTMEPRRMLATNVEARHRRVGTVLREGYRSGERVIRSAQVMLYEYDNESTSRRHCDE